VQHQVWRRDLGQGVANPLLLVDDGLDRPARSPSASSPPPARDSSVWSPSRSGPSSLRTPDAHP
jgi:hypothetical protein